MQPIHIAENPTQQCFEVVVENTPTLTHLLRKIPSTRYDAQRRCWCVALSDRAFLREFCDFAVRRKLASQVLSGESIDNIHPAENMPDLEADCSHMRLQPYDYQRKGIRYMLDHQRCFNGDDMGLGKTFQAIAAVSLAKAYPCLVVCPAAMKVTWQREFYKFIGKQAVILDNSNRDNWQQLCVTGACNVFITNYESVRKFCVQRVIGKRITAANIVPDRRMALFRCVIIDEAHRCKDATTHWSKYLERICEGKPYVFLLTGTPVVISNEDLVQQLRIMGRLDDFGGARRFRERYCRGASKSSNLGELNHRLWQCCYFRREKSEVLTQLPPKTRQFLSVDITNRDEYNNAERDLLGYLRTCDKASDEKLRRAARASAMVQINVLRNIAAVGKMAEAVKFIHDVVDGGNKLIVFAFHKAIISAVVEAFPKCVTVTGSDSQQAKQNAIDAFQNDPDTRLIALNYKSGGVGITLTAASRALFIEFPWTCAECEQSESRCHRNGQKESVNCYYLHARDTIDDRILEIIRQERCNAGAVTGAVDAAEEKLVDLTLNYYKDKHLI